MSGLFDFAKSIGKKLFGGSDDPAAKIKAMIEGDNPGIKDLGVTFKDGLVALTGTGPVAALQKAILMAGNVLGVDKVSVDSSMVAALDDGTQYPRIFEANREVIKDANLIFPGQKIRIPKA